MEHKSYHMFLSKGYILLILSQYFFALSRTIFGSNDKLVYIILSPAAHKNCCIRVIYFQPYIHFTRVHLVIWLSPNHNTVKFFSCHLNFLIRISQCTKNIFPRLTAYGIYISFYVLQHATILGYSLCLGLLTAYS